MAPAIPYLSVSNSNNAVLNKPLQDEAALLITAARTNDTAQIRSLLEDGMHVDAMDEQGLTALAWAIKRRQVAAATLLVEAGANAEIEARDGWTPMSLAVKTGNPTIIEIAMRGLDRHQVKH